MRAVTGIIPLSVGADRIGHAAMRCAGLLAKLGSAGCPVDRDGSGIVAEVYPAASLKQWGFAYRGYKQPRSLGALPELVTALQTAAPWLETSPYDRLCHTSHDALDAVVAALTARAAALDLTLRPDPELQSPSAAKAGSHCLPCHSPYSREAGSFDPCTIQEPRRIADYCLSHADHLIMDCVYMHGVQLDSIRCGAARQPIA